MNRTRIVLGRLFLAVGILMASFSAYVLWGTNITADASQAELAGKLTGTETASVDEARTSLAGSGKDPSDASEGDPIGVIEIRKDENTAGIDLRKVFVAGTDDTDLERGPGLYEGFPFPGQTGNVPIAGHRVTYGAPFGKINELLPGDLIRMTTGQGEFVYEVLPSEASVGENGAVEQGDAYWVVNPEDSSPLNEFGDNRLTLTACHPKFSDAERIIVAAKLIGEPAPTPPREAPTELPTTIGGVDSGWSTEYIPQVALWSLLNLGFLALVMSARKAAGRVRFARTSRAAVALVGIGGLTFGLWNLFGWVVKLIPPI